MKSILFEFFCVTNRLFCFNQKSPTTDSGYFRNVSYYNSSRERAQRIVDTPTPTSTRHADMPSSAALLTRLFSGANAAAATVATAAADDVDVDDINVDDRATNDGPRRAPRVRRLRRRDVLADFCVIVCFVCAMFLSCVWRRGEHAY
jgi:hypothetical protein